MTNCLTIKSFLLKLSVALALVATWEQQGDTTTVVAITSYHTFTQMLLLQSLSGSLSRPLGANRGPLALKSNQGPQFCTKKMMDYVLRSCILWEPGQSKTNILNSFPEKSVCFHGPFTIIWNHCRGAPRGGSVFCSWTFWRNFGILYTFKHRLLAIISAKNLCHEIMSSLNYYFARPDGDDIRLPAVLAIPSVSTIS